MNDLVAALPMASVDRYENDKSPIDDRAFCDEALATALRQLDSCAFLMTECASSALST